MNAGMKRFSTRPSTIRPHISRHNEEDNSTEIAPRSVCPITSTSRDFFHRNGVNGDAEAPIRRTAGEVRANFSTLVSFLVAHAGRQLLLGATAIPNSLHGVRVVYLVQYTLLRQKTKTLVRKKQLICKFTC